MLHCKKTSIPVRLEGKTAQSTRRIRVQSAPYRIVSAGGRHTG
jgi:hypothetical protein